MTVARSVLVSIVGLAVWVLLLPALAVVVLLRAFGSSVNALGKLFALGQPRYERWDLQLRFDARLGFRPAADLDCYTTAYGSDPYHVQTDREGWPGKFSVDDAQVLVVGDSMAAGQGVDAKDTYYGRKLAGLTVKPVACPGYSLAHEYVLIEQLSKDGRLAGKLLVWAVCIGNDLFDGLRATTGSYSGPFVSESGPDWEICYDHLDAAELRLCSAEKGRARTSKAVAAAMMVLYRDSYVSERSFAAARVLIGRAAEMARRAGAGFAILSVPYRWMFSPQSFARVLDANGFSKSFAPADASAFEKRFADLCRDAGALHVSGLSLFGPGDYLTVGDDHLNERGHRKLRALLSKLAEHRPSEAGNEVQRAALLVAGPNAVGR